MQCLPPIPTKQQQLWRERFMLWLALGFVSLGNGEVMWTLYELFDFGRYKQRKFRTKFPDFEFGTETSFSILSEKIKYLVHRQKTKISLLSKTRRKVRSNMSSAWKITSSILQGKGTLNKSKIDLLFSYCATNSSKILLTNSAIGLCFPSKIIPLLVAPMIFSP